MVGYGCRDGEVIYRQGDAATHLYLVLTGEVIISESEVVADGTSVGKECPGTRKQAFKACMSLYITTGDMAAT